MVGTVAGPGVASPRLSSPSRQTFTGSAQSIGLWVFIGVGSTLFTLFLVAYVMRMSEPDATAIGMPWQLWLSTAWLLAGSALMQRSGTLVGPDSRAHALLIAAGLCALVFVAVQWWAWQAMLGQRVSFQGNPAGSFFYLLTALHALHVIGGLAAWAVAMRGLRTEGPEAVWRVHLCARYWHFLLVVWLLLFAAMSLITPEIAGIICGTR